MLIYCNNNNSDAEPSAISISNNYKMLATANNNNNNNNNNAATPKRRGSSNSSLRDVGGLRSEHSSSINLDISELSSSALDDGNSILRDTSERSYHQQSEELVHNTSDSSFIKVALLKQKQKIWNDQHEMDTSSNVVDSWDRKLSILKQKQRDREDMNKQRKQQQQQQQRQQRSNPTRVAASDTIPQTYLNYP